MVPLLEVRGLTKRFGGLQAVRDVSFQMADGELVGLIGPNGAGKTTVFAMLSGFLRPDAGEIRLHGRSVVGLRPHQIAALGVARTFQLVRPFPRLTVLDNVMVGALSRHPHPRRARARAEEVLAQVGLAARWDQPAASLTLADRKRLELARALATEPLLLLLDEVMAGLTPGETERLAELVRAVNRQGVAVLLIEHVMRAVMSLSSRLLVLDHGEPIAAGPPDVVARDPRVIEAYLGEDDETAAPAG